MRDINRIEPFLKEFQKLWEQNQDMRFGQMFAWVENFLKSRDSFYAEEDDWIRAINKCMNKGDQYET